MTMDGILLGFSQVFDPATLLYVFLGVLIGTVIGVLPGLGPTATIALLLPITYTMEPTQAIVMLSGIYYGSMYGGTITSVLLKLPGEAASVVTAIDGYEMTRSGRAGPALGISAVGSFIGATISLLALTLLAKPMVAIAVSFGPPEYVALTMVGIGLVTYLGTGSTWKSLAMAALGLLLATVGTDPITGNSRYTFGELSLLDGFDFVAVAMGLFGVAEILHSLERTETGELLKSRISKVWPSREDFRQSRWAILRGSVLGFFIGILPGGGGVISSMASYAAEKKLAKDPSRFGRGAIEGVAGPETANNASSTAAFIPLLTLGLPPNVVLALIYGALLVQGVTPSPMMISEHPDIFWGVVASMYLGNIMLLVLNIPLVGIFVRILRVKPGILSAFALVITMAGVYSINNDIFDMFVVIAFGVLGWVMKKYGFEPGPLVLAFVLGPILEQSFRQSMLISHGQLSVFITRPISGGILLALVLVIVAAGVGRRAVRRRASTTPNPGDTTHRGGETDDSHSKADEPDAGESDSVESGVAESGVDRD